MPETLIKPINTSEIAPNSAENDEQRLNLLSQTRQKIANELGLTFTLPDPRSEGLMATLKNLALKGTGMAGVYAGRLMFEAGEHGQLLHSAGETEQTFNHMREAVEGVGIGTVAMGALAIFLANRMRDHKELDK